MVASGMVNTRLGVEGILLRGLIRGRQSACGEGVEGIARYLIGRRCADDGMVL